MKIIFSSFLDDGGFFLLSQDIESRLAKLRGMSVEEHAKRNEIKKPGMGMIADNPASRGTEEEVPSDEEADALVERMLQEVNLDQQLGKDSNRIGDDDDDDPDSLGRTEGSAMRG